MKLFLSSKTKGQLTLHTVMILNFRTNRSEQTVFANPFAFFFTKYPKVWPLCLNFRLITAKYLVSENLGTLQ